MPRTRHRRIAFHFYEMEGLWKVFSMDEEVYTNKEKRDPEILKTPSWGRCIRV